MTEPDAQTTTVAPAPTPGRRTAGAAWAEAATMLLLVALTFAAFAPVLRSDFSLWDDPQTIAQNPSLLPPTWAGLAARWSRPFMHIYSPLAHTAWAALAWLSYGETGRPLPPWPFKLASVATHAATGLVVYRLARRAADSLRWPAVVAAALFCVHPIQVEAVAWTSGLKDLLFGLFASATILLYLGDPRDGSASSNARLGLALATAVLASLAKPTAAVLPAMLLVVDRGWLRRPWAESLTRLAPFLVLAAACAVIARQVQSPPPSASPVSLVVRPLVAARAYAFYLESLVAPVRLCFDYGLTPGAILAARGALAWGLLPIAVAVGAWLTRSRRPMLGVGLLLGAIPVLPVCGLVWFDFSEISTVADHYAYLPMLGIAAACASLLAPLARSRLAAILAACAVVGLAALTFRQALFWRDGETVARHTLAINPQSFSSLSHLGTLAVRAGDPGGAEAYQRAALAIRPRYVPALRTLGELTRRRGDLEGAIAWLDRAAAYDPYEPQTWYAIADIELARRRPAAAVAAIERGIAVDPDPTLARRWLASIRATLVRAVAATRNATETGPKP